MHGLMMDMPLRQRLIAHADRHHGDTEIVSKTVDEACIAILRDAHARARKLPNALQRLGVEPGERIADARLDSYRISRSTTRSRAPGGGDPHDQSAAVPGPDHLHREPCEDQYVFFDLSFAPLLESSRAAEDGKGYV